MQKGNETSSKSSKDISFLELVIVNSSFSELVTVNSSFSELVTINSSFSVFLSMYNQQNEMYIFSKRNVHFFVEKDKCNLIITRNILRVFLLIKL